MDGWDLRGDYHLPIEPDVNLFISAFEFENPEEIVTLKKKEINLVRCKSR